MLKYLKKFAMEIVPSVAATIIGAYIVNHYITAKPAADAPARCGVDRRSEESRGQAGRDREYARRRRQGEGHLRKGHDGEDGRRKGRGGRKAEEKSALSRSVYRKAADTRSIEQAGRNRGHPAEPRRHQPAPREKVARTAAASRVQPVRLSSPWCPISAPADAASRVGRSPRRQRPCPCRDRTAARQKRRRASAAGSRTRAGNAAGARDRLASPEAPRVAAAPACGRLPPPIMVSTPPNENFNWGLAAEAALCRQRRYRRSASPDAARRHSAGAAAA